MPSCKLTKYIYIKNKYRIIEYLPNMPDTSYDLFIQNKLLKSKTDGFFKLLFLIYTTTHREGSSIKNILKYVSCRCFSIQNFLL